MFMLLAAGQAVPSGQGPAAGCGCIHHPPKVPANHESHTARGGPV